MRALLVATTLAVTFLAGATATAAEQQLLDPNRTLRDGWHTVPAALTVRQAIDDGCRFPVLSACASGDKAYGDRRDERYEVGFEAPHGEDVSYLRGTAYVLTRHRPGTRSHYALRVTRGGLRRVVQFVNDVHSNGWLRIPVPLMTIAEARTISLAGRVSRASTGSPRVANFVAYIGLNFVPRP